MIIWHRHDLRTRDNPALNAAERPKPVYVFNPDWLNHELVSDQRIEFLLESLKDLNAQYIEKGSHLTLLHGDPIKKLSGLEEEVAFNIDSNTLLRGLEEKARERFTAVNGTPVNTDGRTRDWGAEASKWFRSEIKEPPGELPDNDIESEVTLEEIREKYVEKEKNGWPGGRTGGLKRLKEFKHRIDRYAGCISSPSKAEASTSHLSPYIREGCLSIREVFQEVQEEDSRSAEMFKDRLIWHQHFRQKIEDNPDLTEEAVNPVYRGLHNENRDEEKTKAWKNGETGYPLVDASMRALKQTGWLNFRMRAMCASFFTYILKQPWKTGADHFYRKLIDADPSINYYQWQMQSGLIGVHANRIYNPMKQVEENDPEGKFIKEYLPELKGLPKTRLAKPWQLTEKEQEKHGIKIGEDYPRPIVNYEREARKARKFFKRKAPEAYAAFKDDEVWKKASLSDSHSREEILEKAGKQEGLEQYF